MNLLPLKAGNLTMLFDFESGFLRQIRFGENEIVRGIYAVVRDKNWETAPTVLSNVVTKAAENSFRIKFDAVCQQGTIDFRWRGSISGSLQDKVTFCFDGQARSAFERNRIGICVLHPIKECRGARARIVQTSGKRKTLRFSEQIDPQIRGKSRFGEMRSLAYEFAPGLWAELHFTGDVFEMEDQRNWTDASFKTYCPPLAKKFPVRIISGTRVRQRVTLRLSGRTVGQKVCAPSDLIQVPRFATHQLPQIGLGVASDGQELGSSEIQPLKRLRLAHLRTDLWFGQTDWSKTFASAKHDAQLLGAKLELAIHLPEHDCEREFRELSKLARKQIARILVFREGEEATSLETMRLARRFINLPGVPIGGGSDAHFCELNRAHALGRFGDSECDFVSWPITPQVHAFDDLTVMENIEAQSDTVITARALAGKRPLIVSPITLRPRFNAVASSSRPAIWPGRRLPEADLRQASLMTAAWTLGSIAALGKEGVTSMTFFETRGPRGVINALSAQGSDKRFPLHRGPVNPAYFVFAALAGFPHGSPVCRPTDKKIAVVALFARNVLNRIVFANLRSETSPVRLAVSAPHGRLHLLDENNLGAATTHPQHILQKGKSVKIVRNTFEIVLAPHALGILDLW